MKNKVKEAFVKVYSLVREWAYSAQIDHSGNYIPYGSDRSYDSFPNELYKLIEGSTTATACLSTLADFIAGEGFNEVDLESKVVNSQGLKLFQLNLLTAESLAYHEGFAWLIKYNKLGEVTQWYHIPFSSCRLGKPDDNGYISKIHYNPYFGSIAHYQKKDTEIYDVYNPNAALLQYAQQGDNYKGQIFWFGIIRAGHHFYPWPKFYSAREWMRTEHNTAVYFDENAENGFLQSSILRLVGNPNESAYPNQEPLDENEEPVTKGKALNDEMGNNFSGSKRGYKMWVFWADNKDEWPDIIPFPQNANAENFRVQDEQSIKKITIATNVPAILANISEGVSLGGDGNTIRAAVKLQQQRVVRLQRILTDAYQEILSNFVTPFSGVINIIPYNPFPELNNIDPQIWQELSREERRKWIKDHTEVVLLEDEGEDNLLTDDTPPGARFQNILFNTYPEAAKANAKRALEWQDKFGTCGGSAGKKLAQRIMNGEPLSSREIKRLSRYLSSNIKNRDKEFDKSCDAVNYYAWGGPEMLDWSTEKVKELWGS